MTVLICGVEWHAQDYRGRLPAAESWRRYQAGREADGGDEDGGLAWVDGVTAALQNVRPDGVQSGERPGGPRSAQRLLVRLQMQMAYNMLLALLAACTGCKSTYLSVVWRTHIQCSWQALPFEFV